MVVKYVCVFFGGYVDVMLVELNVVFVLCLLLNFVLLGNCDMVLIIVLYDVLVECYGVWWVCDCVLVIDLGVKQVWLIGGGMFDYDWLIFLFGIDFVLGVILGFVNVVIVV